MPSVKQTFKVDVNIEIRCSCGTDLTDNTTIVSYNESHNLVVRPCQACQAKAESHRMSELLNESYENLINRLLDGGYVGKARTILEFRESLYPEPLSDGLQKLKKALALPVVTVVEKK